MSTHENPIRVCSGRLVPRADRRARLRGALLVSAVAAVLVRPPLGQRTISTSDEARFPLLARDMIERGVWFDAYVREKQYRNKPPLYPWFIAAFSLPQGPRVHGNAVVRRSHHETGAVDRARARGSAVVVHPGN